ncbi:transposase [Anaeromyxobacter oryzisoli]|uniref:transposase n=1 Tax=Anaeromyxobacter oryzisoli TaxID=2925408 RepID=UPI0038CBFD61
MPSVLGGDPRGVPETREERCWVHIIANVLDKLPQSFQPKTKAALHEMMNAPTRTECQKLVAAFVTEWTARRAPTLSANVSETTTPTEFSVEGRAWTSR